MGNGTRSLLACAAAAILAACQGSPAGSARTLDRLNWSERNHAVLNQLVIDHGPGGTSREPGRTDYVVLDWDSTMAQFDVQETALRYQAFTLRYRLTKQQFRDLLVDDVNGVTRLSAAFGSVALADLHADLASDYAFLYDAYAGLGGAQTLESVLATAQWQDFFVKLVFLYDGYIETPGIGADYAFPWVMYLLAGHTIPEVKVLAREAIARELGTGLAKVKQRSPAALPGRAGVVEATYDVGLRVIPEMQDLVATLQANGIDVFIVSASFKPIVEAFGAPGAFGYGIPPEKVIAMELDVDANGVLQARYKAGWVRTYRQGKVDAIERVIKVGLGRNWDPVLAAGDTSGDYEMLTAFPGTKVGLVWNRLKGGDIGKLCSLAVAVMGSAAPR
jgi:HAD superfamily phosphoserine phosphatase-like hydrolase